MTRCLKSLSNPVALPDLCFDSFSYPVAFIVSVTWLLWHYFFYCFFFQPIPDPVWKGAGSLFEIIGSC